MIFKALIVDFGGVLTNPLERVVRDFCVREGVEQEGMRVIFGGHDDGSFEALERGDISQEQWNRDAAAQLGVSSENLLSRVLASLEKAEPMIRAVQNARAAGLLTAVVTNSYGTHPHDPYEPWKLEELVDVVVISGVERVRKPDAEIYRRTLERLGVDGHECVYIDDNARNLIPAQKLGMRTILHTDADQSAREIADLLV